MNVTYQYLGRWPIFRDTLLVPSILFIGGCGAGLGLDLCLGNAPCGARAQGAAFDRGVLTRAPGDTLILAPPFISTPEDIQRMANLLRMAIEDTAQPET